jgi:hypothetical protein
VGDDGGLGALTGLLNLGAGGVNLFMRGVQQVPRIVQQGPRVLQQGQRVVRMAGDKFNRLPQPVQATVRNVVEYGFPVFNYGQAVGKGQDPLEAAAEVISGEVAGRVWRGGGRTIGGKVVRDIAGNVLGDTAAKTGISFGKWLGEQPTETAPGTSDPTMPEWRRRLEQGY